MNTEQLIANGYKIENAKITSADLSMEDHGCLTFSMGLEAGGWGCNYGGYCLGHGYLGAKKFRVATKGWGDVVKIIGNVIQDQWFDPEAFFKEEK